jgi:hypothetical protein
MTRLVTPYALPALLAAVLCGGVMVVAWNRRRAAEAGLLLVVMGLAGLWSLGYALELMAVEVEAKQVWLKVQYLGAVGAPMAALAFAILLTGHRAWLTGPVRAILVGGPVLMGLIIFTNDLRLTPPMWCRLCAPRRGRGSGCIWCWPIWR